MSTGVAIVGLGARGLRCLGGAICSIGSQAGVHVSGIYDHHAGRLSSGVERLDAMHEAHGVPASYRVHHSLESLVRDDATDLIMITTPQFAHEEVFALAAATGKPIYCDKPLAHDQPASDRMRQVWRDRAPRCMTGLTRRYEPVWRRAADLVADGAIGTPRMLLLRAVIPSPNYFGRGWMRRRSLSGDIVNEKGSHHFDVLNWFAGSAVTAVHAVGGRSAFAVRPGYPEYCTACGRDCVHRRPQAQTLPDNTTDAGFLQSYPNDPDSLLDRNLCVYSPDADILDHVIANLTFANGVVATLFLSIFGPRADDQETFEVVGDDGRLRLTRHTGRIEVVTSRGQSHHEDCRSPEHRTSHFGADRALIREVPGFVSGAAPSVGFPEAYAASTVAFGALDSISSGQVWHPSGGQIQVMR